jgi:hypothetical protein
MLFSTGLRYRYRYRSTGLLCVEVHSSLPATAAADVAVLQTNQTNQQQQILTCWSFDATAATMHLLLVCLPASLLSHRHTYTIPTNLDLAGVAPLLCAGITTYAPYKDHGFDKPGKKVGGGISPGVLSQPVERLFQHTTSRAKGRMHDD